MVFLEKIFLIVICFLSWIGWWNFQRIILNMKIILNNGKSRVLPNYQKDLIFLIAEGRGDEVIAEYKRLYDKGTFRIN